MPVGEQPTRRLGDGGQEDQEEDGGHRHDAEHPAPRGVFVRDFADDRVGGVGQEDTEDDVELDQADQASAHAGGGDFGGVDGSDHGGQADADAAQEAEDHEEGDREGGRGRNRAVSSCHQGRHRR